MKKMMFKLHDSRAFWMILSLAISMVLWIYVSSVETEEFKQTFRGVRVELVGESLLRENKSLVITDLDVNSVTVEVVGPRRVVAGLDSDDIVAQIDVSKLTRSAYTSQQYTVVFPDGTDTSALTVNRKTPETVNFLVSTQTNKTIPVRGSFDGSLAGSYTAETPVFEPSTITVYGPESYLKNIDHAWVSFSKDDVSSTYQTEAGFSLMDAEGEACSTSGLTFSTDTVNATLPVLLIKEVPLAVNLIEGAGATSENTKIRIEPASITLAGDSGILEGMNKLVLDSIDLTDFASTFTEVYTIPLDNELNNMTGITEATVNVEIVGLETKLFKVSNISCINVTEGFTAEIITQNLDVTLRGSGDVLSQIKDENVRAVADLVDMDQSVGTYMPKVKFYVDGFTNVGALGESTISIEIERTS